MISLKKGAGAENQTLKWMTLITSAGDYFTLFAVVQITQDLFANTWLSAFNVIVQSAAVCLAAVFTPKILYHAHPRAVFLWTQWSSAGAIFALFAALEFNAVRSPWPLYLVLFIVTFLWHVFSTARESLSKGITQHDHEHQNMQSELLSGFYSAQFLGPLAAVAAILWMGPKLPLLLDALSFVVCGVLALRIQSRVTYETKMSIVRPLKYLQHKPELLKLLLLRTAGFWVPIGIYNYVMFKIAETAFVNVLPEGNAILGSALIYALAGMGGLVGNLSVRYNLLGLKTWSNPGLALMANLVMSAALLAMLATQNTVAVLTLNFVLAFGFGVNALSTQTLRRKLASHSEFAEIVSLDGIVGRGFEWATATLVAYLIMSHGVSSNATIVFASVWLALVALCYRTFR